MGHWFYNPKPPENRAEVAAFGAILLGLIFVCIGWEIAARVAPDRLLIGVIGGFGFGIAAALIGIRWYLARNAKPLNAIDALDEGTATDPSLYNVPDDDL